MLGAQALRTKQKVERKEKEKRQKERVRNAELQRERLQKVASEDAAALFDAPHHSAVPVARQHQRLSVSAVHQHRVTAPLVDDDGGRRTPSPTPVSAPALPPARSPSTDFASDRMASHHNGHASSTGGRLMKFLGLSSHSSHMGDPKKDPKRRMSTY